MLHLCFLITGDFLSMGLMTNFLSLKEIFRISLQGNPILGVSLLKNRNTNMAQSIAKNLQQNELVV